MPTNKQRNILCRIVFSASADVLNIIKFTLAAYIYYSYLYRVKNSSDSFCFSQVEDRFSASYSSGRSLLTKINDTLSKMDESLSCFDNAKSDAQNASHMAQVAFNISENAKQVSSLLFSRLIPYAVFSVLLGLSLVNEVYI